MLDVILGFDFGLKRIGVAVGQTVTKTATPLLTLAAQNGEPAWSEVQALINEWQPDRLVVGLPLNMDGSEQPITEQARLFAHQLEQRFKQSVALIDERLTTKEARASVFEKSGYSGLQTADIDSVAAMLIMEDYFNEYSGRCKR